MERARLMRWVICAVVVLALTPTAFAQDADDILRGTDTVGPATFPKWSGFYFGGQIGYSDVNADFSNSTQTPIAYVLRNSTLEATSEPSQLPALGTADHGGTAYGGFAGYNTQWQDLILGIETNFNHTSLSLNAPSSPIVRSGFTDGTGNTYTVGIAATGTVTDLDYGSLRARAGWVLGNFLPYGFAGLAVGHANIQVTDDVAGTCDAGSNPTCGPFAFNASSGGSSTWLYGFTVGGGLDVALTQNIFLRGEFEYIRFAQEYNIPIAITSARVGAGFKF
jgi:outer membrane immunogenic protein